MTQGIVGNIQKYSIHDGPGIRSSLFLKGCPLRCAWCHNPETQSFIIQTTWQKEKCIGCGDCVEACPSHALSATPEGIIRDEQACAHCGDCADVCPALAWERHGYRREAAEVVAELRKDSAFYEASGGGVTLSGGEPLAQPEFSLEVLRLLKAQDIHTTLDTSGQAPWEVLERFVPLVDLFLYDIKQLDTTIHAQYMGLGNELILSNLERLAPIAKEIWLRLPLVPGVNDSPEHLTAVGALMKKLNLRRLHLLPYHGLAENKYRKLGLAYTLSDLQAPTEERMQELQRLLAAENLEVHIGG